MPSFFKRFLQCETCLAVLIIVLITGLAYLPLINQLGLSKEDWYLIWSGQARGPQDFLSLYQADRPFAGYIYQLVYPLLGASPLHWHIQAFLLRLIGVLSFFWLLRMLWPEHKFVTTAAAILFAVYPGYLQQPNAVNKTFWLTSLTFAILSITLSVYAVRLKKGWQVVIAYVFSILLAAVYPLIIEFYIGFEAVRFILIWYALQQKERKSLVPGLVRALVYYLPYLLSAAIFVYWRVFVFTSTRPTTDIGRLLGKYLDLPVHMIGRIFIETVQDFFETTVLAWSVPPYQLLSEASYRELAVSAILGALAAGLLVVYYRWLKRRDLVREDSPVTNAWMKDFIWIGTLTVLITLLPAILAGREVNFSLTSREDHYTIQAALGVGLLLVGLLYFALRSNLRLAALSFLIGISVMTHVQNAFVDKVSWETHTALWWQLAWRAPQLKDGTLLLVNLPPGQGFIEGYETWAPANLIYAPEATIPRITGEVLNKDSLLLLDRAALAPKNHREIRFNLNYAAPLILSLPTDHSCLNVIDGQRYELSEEDDLLILLAAPYSKIEAVLTGVPFQALPQTIFGGEPAHTWCYYYQKAMYARQIGDWGAIAGLGDEAQRKGLAPNDRTEWMPFLEGYTFTGREKEARVLAEYMQAEQGPRRAICQRLMDQPAPSENYDVQKIVAILCGS